MRELALSYGICPFYLDRRENTDSFKRAVTSYLLEQEEIAMGDRVIIVGGSFGPRKGASFIEISKVSDLQNNLLE